VRKKTIRIGSGKRRKNLLGKAKNCGATGKLVERGSSMEKGGGRTVDKQFRVKGKREAIIAGRKSGRRRPKPNLLWQRKENDPSEEKRTVGLH